MWRGREAGGSPERGGRLLWRISLTIGAVALSCAAPLEPRIVTVPQADVRPARHISDISDYDLAATTIARLVEQEVGIGQIPVAFRFFPTPQAFEAVLLQAGYDAQLARETAQEMRAVAGHRAVLLNESKLVTLSWPDRVALLAHEFTHSLQYELGGGRRGGSDQWLREGFADWVSIRVIERLRAVRRGDLRRQRIEEFREAGSRISPLSQMVTFRQWVALSARTEGSSYLQAFLAVDFLIERHGMRAIVDYFSRFARSDDRLANFRATFGEDLAAFEKVLTSRLRRL